MDERKPIVEIDFINKYIIRPQDSNMEVQNVDNRAFRREMISEGILTKFLGTLDELWHSDSDQIEYFQYYSDGYYFCQRKRKKYNFQTETYYWNTYSFTAATSAQAEELAKHIGNLFTVTEQVKTFKVEASIKEIDHEAVFFDQKYLKLKRQRQTLLEATDWRILSDVPEKYEGEKARWIQWRAWIRDNSTPKPSDEQFAGSGLDYFKYTYEMKFPVDPAVYDKMYPNGKLDDGVTDAPAFLDASDTNQWVKHDTEASSDFYAAGEANIYAFAGQEFKVRKKMSQKVIDLMKLLQVEDEVPVDWTRLVATDDELGDG